MYSPTPDEVLKFAAQGNLIPVTRRILADLETPLSAYRKIRGEGESFLFESVEGGEHIGRYSFVGCNPRAVIRQDGQHVQMFENGRVTESAVVGRNVKDGLEVIDRVAQTITILVNAILGDAESPAEAYENATSEIERIVSLLEQPSEHIAVAVTNDFPSVEFESNQTKEKFFANVEASKKLITAGDIIQVVGSQRFSAPVTASPLDIYRAARSINPSPYMFLLELDGFSLVGASPEIHVPCEEGKVEIRPIAGTRRRGKNEAGDSALEKELLADPKERADACRQSGGSPPCLPRNAHGFPVTRQ